MGLTRLQTLTRVELPLAVPAIIGGLRIAVVSTVSIATIAAFLLPEGLGYPIFLALKEPTPFKTEIYSAGALAIAFALGCDRPARRPAPCPRTVGRRRARMMPTLADAANLHTFVDAFRFIGDHPGFLATKALEQLELSGAALGIALAVALPVGVVLGHFHRGSGIAIGASIVGRALPSLVLIAAFLTVLGIGFVNNMVALAVLGSGPILTNSYDGGRPRRQGRGRSRTRDGHDRPADRPPNRAAARDSPALHRDPHRRGDDRRHRTDRRDRRRRRARRHHRQPGELPALGRARRLALRDGAVRARVRRPSWSSDRRNAQGVRSTSVVGDTHRKEL